jgi:fructosamine-3-kinase
MHLIDDIFKEHGIEVQSSRPLSGGDINDVYHVKSKDQDFVIKLNSASQYPDMFEKEAKSLKLLSETRSFIIPEVKAFGQFEGKTYLIMTHISSGQNKNFSEKFAVALAKLHRQKSTEYGLDFDNYIGRLPQSNLPKTEDPVEFYINLRLEPQFKLAHDQGFEFDKLNTFYKNLEQMIPKENASLIHGDLWSGNYLITDKNEACIYDPAISYASREMDLAMMQLFGGYPKEIFKVYNDIFPLEKEWTYRIELWQLYYILVHVNLFGASYYSSAKRLLAKYNT